MTRSSVVRSLSVASTAVVWSSLWSFVQAAEFLESIDLIDGGRVVMCHYEASSDAYLFTCEDIYAVFGLQCFLDVAETRRVSALTAGVYPRKEVSSFVCPVTPMQSVAGEGLQLDCRSFNPRRPELLELLGDLATENLRRLEVEGRLPTVKCDSRKIEFSREDSI